jgi:hypothetical protein
VRCRCRSLLRLRLPARLRGRRSVFRAHVCEALTSRLRCETPTALHLR